MTKNSNNNKHEIINMGSSLDQYMESLKIKCPKLVFNKLDTVIEINVNIVN